jgi:hypothetical protein
VSSVDPNDNPVRYIDPFGSEYGDDKNWEAANEVFPGFSNLKKVFKYCMIGSGRTAKRAIEGNKPTPGQAAKDIVGDIKDLSDRSGLKPKDAAKEFGKDILGACKDTKSK